MMRKYLIISLFLLKISFSVANASSNIDIYNSKIDFAPLFFNGSDLEENDYITALGPFYESRNNIDTGNYFYAFHPFYSVSHVEKWDWTLHEYLWPIGMYKTFRGQSYWRFLLAYGVDFDIYDPESRYRYSLFPIIFGGKDINKEKYFAIFPLGGSIHEFLGQDKITFVLFPLYLSYQIHDVKTRYYLWPIFSKTTGDKVHRGGVFPIYGYSRNENLEVWEKNYILWPFWTHVTYKEPEKGYAYILFPLFGHAKVGEHKRTLMLLPPFFRFSKGIYRDKPHVEWNCPWPFIRYMSGEEEKFYIWPLWGHKEITNQKKWFALWPIMLGKKLYRRTYFSNRLVILPFYQNEERYKYLEPGNTKDRKQWDVDKKSFQRSLKIWPLVNYNRYLDSSRTSVLALWPFKSVKNVDRNYQRLWTLYSHTKVKDEKEDEFLWGLFRWRRNKSKNHDLQIFPIYHDSKQSDDKTTHRKWNILYGLISYERNGLQKQYKILYILNFKNNKNNRKE